MKNFIQTIKERRSVEEERLDEENKRRKERLTQLEDELKSKKGFSILHPIQSKKMKGEIEQLQREILEYESRNEKKKNHWQIIGLCAIGCLLLIIAFINETIRGPKDSGNKSVVSEQEVVDITETASVDSEEKTSTEATTIITTEMTKVIEEKKTENKDTKTTTESLTEKTEVMTSTEEALDLDIPMFTAYNMNVSYECDYSHENLDTIKLGNDEGVTVIIEALRKDVEEEDILVVYDEELISVRSEEPLVQNNKTYFKYYITGKTECTTDIGFFTRYDYLTKGEDLEGYILDIKKCNSEDGRVCYVTNSGSKYHYSVDCAGASATKTIYWDVKSFGDSYQPCGKCAN